MYEILFGYAQSMMHFLGTLWDWLSSPLIPAAELWLEFFDYLPAVIVDYVEPLFLVTPFHLIISAFSTVIILKVLALIWTALPIV